MCHNGRAKCSRNAGFQCHSGSVETKCVKNKSNQVKIGSSMGQTWVTWVTWAMLKGLWVLWVLWVTWTTGQVDLCKMAIGATGSYHMGLKGYHPV